MSAELVVHASEWDRLALVIPKAKLEKLKEMTVDPGLGSGTWRDLKLTSAEKAAWAGTKIFEGYVLGRLVDIFMGTGVPVEKREIYACKMLMDWRRMAQGGVKDEAIDLE